MAAHHLAAFASARAVPIRLSRAPSRPLCARNRPARAALAVELLHLGRRSGKDAVYDGAVDTLTTRMRGALRLDERWVRPSAAVTEVRKLSAKRPVLLLHERGKMPKCSVDFSAILYDRLQRGGSRVAFVVGGDDGLPGELLAMAEGGGNVETMSLGPLTLTHKMCRLFFVEQLYRAAEIRAGSKYHR